MVNNVAVTVLNATSVSVSWDLLPLTVVNQYIIFYSQTGNRKRQTTESNVIVSNVFRSVVITGLTTGAEYQFQVVGQVFMGGRTINGMRSGMLVLTVRDPNGGVCTYK